jgi:hypothetical protein
MLNVFFAYATSTQGDDAATYGLPAEPAKHGTFDGSLVCLSESEQWNGVIGTYVQLGKNEDGTGFLECGEVHEQYENQDIPFLPNSVANLDLARLTVWGWILLLSSPFAIVLPAIGVGEVIGVEQLPQSLRWPAAMIFLPVWGFLFILGRVALESQNITVVRRKKTAEEST